MSVKRPSEPNRAGQAMPAHPSPEPSSADARALAIALQDQVLKAWDIYIKFYTVFLTVNFVALGVVVEKVDDPWSRLFIALAFVVQNAGSSATALAMREHTSRIANQQAGLGYPQLPLFSGIGRWGGLLTPSATGRSASFGSPW